MHTFQDDLDKLIALHTTAMQKQQADKWQEYDEAYAKFVQDYGHAQK